MLCTEEYIYQGETGNFLQYNQHNGVVELSDARSFYSLCVHTSHIIALPYDNFIKIERNRNENKLLYKDVLSTFIFPEEAC